MTTTLDPPNTLPAEHTWTAEMLATARRMLREEADELSRLALLATALASAVAWESAAAEAFRRDADDIRRTLAWLGDRVRLLAGEADGLVPLSPWSG